MYATVVDVYQCQGKIEINIAGDTFFGIFMVYFCSRNMQIVGIHALVWKDNFMRNFFSWKCDGKQLNVQDDLQTKECNWQEWEV